MIRIVLPYPPSVNGLTSNAPKGRAKTDDYRLWLQKAGLCVKDSHRAGFGPYCLHIAVRKPDKRRRDLGNIEKAVSDLLVAHGVVKDDCLAQSITLQWDAGMQEECVVLIQEASEGMAS